MEFDTSELDAACMADDATEEAIWYSKLGPKRIRVHFTIGSDYEEEDGVKFRVDDEIRAGTLESSIKGMQRKDKLKIKGKTYFVLGFEPDGSGWTDILLD